MSRWPTLRELRSFSTTDGIGQDIEPPKGRPALISPVTTILHVPREPLEPLGRKHEKRRGKSITASPVSCPFLGASRDEDTEALGHVTDCTTEEGVRGRASRETPSKGKEGEEARERANKR